MTKAAILIDGGYFLTRLPVVRPDVDAANAKAVADSVGQLVHSHLRQLNEALRVPSPASLLYRSFYYDARPYDRKGHTAVDKRAIDYSKTEQAIFRNELFEALRRRPNLALRLGEVRRDSDRAWILKPEPQRRLLRGEITFNDVSDRDFAAALRQKGVDMRIGLDIAAITLKRQAEIVVLVSGDADFVPAAKLARREGMQFILDPLWQNVSRDLFEHIDGLRSGFSRPRRSLQ
ncbi:MAG: NYN domain-containing protein [Acidobacteria bacterium]|nr:NYN domain-containing protein [Acidobacteriota bacterium]